MTNIVSRTLSVHKEHELLVKLEAAGLSDTLAQRVIESKDNDLAIKVVALIQNRGFEPSISQRAARTVMGKNFFGVEEAIRHFGVNPTKQQLATLAEVPFSEEVLMLCRDTHVLVAVFPMSILDIRGHACKQSVRPLFYSQTWYDKEVFAKDKGEVGWHLIRKEPVAGSVSKTWDDQQFLLSKNEWVPTAQIVVYSIIGHFLAFGERLFENVYVRCVDSGLGGGHVVLGYFGAQGLVIDDLVGDDRAGFTGLSVAWKH